MPRDTNQSKRLTPKAITIFPIYGPSGRAYNAKRENTMGISASIVAKRFALPMSVKHMQRAFVSTVLLFLAVIPSSVADNFVTANILSRVLALRSGSLQGSGFTIEVEGRQYIVTAKHMVPGTNQLADVSIYRSEKWGQLSMRVLRSEEADVAVLVPPFVVTPSLPLVYGSEGTMLSQEVFFLGFPDMLSSDVPADLNNGFPIPFIKRGTLSAWYRGKSKYATILVDGINNPGFSGGPLVVANGQNKELRVLGVVIGYKTDRVGVMNKNLDTGLESLANSGIIICYDIQYALDEIKKQQDGPIVPHK